MRGSVSCNTDVRAMARMRLGPRSRRAPLVRRRTASVPRVPPWGATETERRRQREDRMQTGMAIWHVFDDGKRSKLLNSLQQDAFPIHILTHSFFQSQRLGVYRVPQVRRTGRGRDGQGQLAPWMLQDRQKASPLCTACGPAGVGVI